MQAWAAFGLLGPGVTAAFPQFDQVGALAGREGGGTALVRAPRRREGAAPARIQTKPRSLAPTPARPAAADATP